MTLPIPIQGYLKGHFHTSFDSLSTENLEHGDCSYGRSAVCSYPEAATGATNILLTTLSTNSDFGNPSAMHQSYSSSTPALPLPLLGVPANLADEMDNEWSMFDSEYAHSWNPDYSTSYCGSLSDSGESENISTFMGTSPSLIGRSDTRSTSPQLPISSTTENRRTRRQQQNRKAQRAYRERQTLVLSSAKEQVRALTQKLEDLSRSNAALEVRAKALSDRVIMLQETKTGRTCWCNDFDSFDLPPVS